MSANVQTGFTASNVSGLVFYAYRDNIISVSNLTSLGNYVGMTGYSIKMSVKVNMSDADAAAIYKSTPTSSNLAFGQFTFLIPRSTTSSGSWITAPTVYWDISFIDTSNNASTLAYGTATIQLPVTQVIV